MHIKYRSVRCNSIVFFDKIHTVEYYVSLNNIVISWNSSALQNIEVNEQVHSILSSMQFGSTPVIQPDAKRTET